MGRPRKQQHLPAPSRRGRSQAGAPGDGSSIPSSATSVNGLIANAPDKVSSNLNLVIEPSSPVVSSSVVSSMAPVVFSEEVPVALVISGEVPVVANPTLQAESPIPNGGVDPVVIPAVHRPTWMDRVANSPVGIELHHVQDGSKDGEVVIEVADIQEEIEYWLNTFSKPEDLALVLRGSTRSLGGHALVLKVWSPRISSELETISRVPVWITLPNLDPLFWSEKALSKIGSKVSVPLYADPVTTHKERLSFARVMVELGHEKDKCRLFKKQEARVKQTVAASAPPPTVIAVSSSTVPKVIEEVVDESSNDIVPPVPGQALDSGENAVPVTSVSMPSVQTSDDGGAALASNDGFTQVINNYGSHPNGRIWLFWSKSSLTVQILSCDSQWIHVMVTEMGRSPFLITFIYAFNTSQGQTALWDFLKGVTPAQP
ncbi:hypothetical protein RND81_01G029000 [Saponaria officinalis]|uniref:DUF4283 domain-containing protein n=1 Tax=Saponaria officinalis TaxID=3572 RepID=A0AAW1N5R2_SAPOF